MLQHFLSDAWAARCSAAVFAALACSLALFFIRERKVGRLVGELSEALRDILGGTQTSRPDLKPLTRIVSRHLAFPLKGGGTDTVVLRSPVEDALSAEGLRLLRRGPGSWAYQLGENLTAIALVLTFGLLAEVLIGPVFESLRMSGPEQTAHLSQALLEMGAKFIVSATGVLGSLVFQWVSHWREQRMCDSLTRAWETAAPKTELLDSWTAKIALAHRGSFLELKHELSEVRSGFRAELEQTRAALFQKLDRLESVEVSLQDIGTNVQASFSTMMKQHVADVIRDKIASVEASVRTVVEQLQAQFSAALQQEMGQICELLRQLHTTVADQSASDLEKVVLQLRDAVSGGFQSQSQDMAHQLSALAEVLPRLERQFAAVTDNLHESARHWGEENQRSISALAERMSSLLSAFEEARGGMRASVELLMDASSQAQSRMVEATQHQAVALSEQVLDIRSSAAREHQEFESRVQAFAQAMAKSQDELLHLTQSIRAMSSELVSALRTTSQAQAESRDVLGRLVEGVKRMAENTLAFDGMVKQRSELVTREETLLGAQRAAVDGLAPVVQQTMNVYEEAIKKQTSLLAAEWQRLAGAVTGIVDRSSNGLVESLDDLQDVLAKAMKEIGGRRST